MRNRTSATVAAIAALCLVTPATARPFQVDDLLHEQSFGRAMIDPSGRWLVFEQRDPYDTGTRFEGDGAYDDIAHTRLKRVDLIRPVSARALIADPAAHGEMIAGFSPSGARLAIYRLAADRWRLGVVTVRTGQVRWYGVAPELPRDGRGLQWLSDRDLLVITRPDGSAPMDIRYGHLLADKLPALWRASANGTGAHTVLGAGAYADVRPRPLPSRLIRLRTDTGEARVLATGELQDLEISPDHRRVALREAGADVRWHAQQGLQGDWGVGTQRQRLSILDLTTGQRLTPCPACDALPLVMAWSPDSTSLLTYSRAVGLPWSAGALQRIDAVTGAVSTMGSGLHPLIEGRPEVVRAGWMGEDPIFLARPAEGTRLDWYRLTRDGVVNLTADLATVPKDLAALSQDGLALISAHQLWRIDPAGHATAVPGPEIDPTRLARDRFLKRLYSTPPAQTSVVTQGSDGSAQLEQLDVHGRTRRLDLKAGVATLVAVSPTGRVAVLKSVDDQGVETLRVAVPRHREIVVSAINRPLKATDVPTVRPIAHRGPNGEALTSWLFLPPIRPDRSPPPLVVVPYSGLSHASLPRDPPPPLTMVISTRILVGHGYAVLVPSLPLPRPTKDPMAGLGDRILAIVDQAAADPQLAGAFDTKHLALWGLSYGAYTTMASVTQTDRFSAGIAIAGSSDLIGMWGAVTGPGLVAPEEDVWWAWTAGWTETSQGAMGDPPWIDPDRYIRNSPLFAADRIHTPLMLVHGDQDAIPPSQGDAMLAALDRQGKDGILVNYWGEGHVISSPGNIRDFYHRAFAFLDDLLKFQPLTQDAPPAASPGPAPANARPRTPPSLR